MIVTQPESGAPRGRLQVTDRRTVEVDPVDATGAVGANGTSGGPGTSDTVERCGWSLVWLAVVSGGVALWGSWSSWSLAGLVAPLLVLAGIGGLAATWLVASPRSWTVQLTALGAVVASTLSSQGVAIHVRQYYVTDAAAFNQVAARTLVHGSDPYTASLVSAAQLLRVPSDFWTYTMTGSFVTHVSYPAGSFLLDVPALALGFHHEIVDWTDLYAWILTGVLIFVLIPSWGRWFAALVLVTPVFIGTFSSGGTDAAFLPFLVLAVWRWDRFGLGRESGVARWMGPIALGLACSIKQTPWFCIPFIALGLYLEARSSGRRPMRLVLRYLATVVSVFTVVNLPFIVWQPSAWARGTLLPFSSPLVPDGQGLVTLALHGLTRGVSLPMLSVAGVLVLVTLLAALVVWYPFMKRIWMLLVPLIFFVATRSLSTYLLDLYPAAVIAAISVSPARPSSVGREGRARAILGLAAIGSAVAAMVVSALAFLSPPLEIGVRSVSTSQAASSLAALTLRVQNHTDETVEPHFMVSTGNANPDGFWYPAHRRPFVLGPHRASTVTVYPSSASGAPHHGSHWLVVAYTSSPDALSTSPLQFWRLGQDK
jgi:uncharacterized membrane protein